jgi:hypothetical protein
MSNHNISRNLYPFRISVGRAVSSQYYNSKGKATPLQAWTGPEGSRSLRLQDF